MAALALKACRAAPTDCAAVARRALDGTIAHQIIPAAGMIPGWRGPVGKTVIAPQPFAIARRGLT